MNRRNVEWFICDQVSKVVPAVDPNRLRLQVRKSLDSVLKDLSKWAAGVAEKNTEVVPFNPKNSDHMQIVKEAMKRAEEFCLGGAPTVRTVLSKYGIAATLEEVRLVIGRKIVTEEVSS